MSYFFGVVILFLFGTAFYNFETAKESKKTLNVFVIDKTEQFRHKKKYLKLDIGNHTERFRPTTKEWKRIEINDTIKLTVGLGQLGYEHIFNFTPNKPD
ncbi:MAG: hypothetical protein R2798_10505 [Chitinophagales bacterium]|nr:hypothetical protein [Bacteroidota bacterium]MCB9044014.1 hypothetical protein [Chitinophagales bacterium]